MARIKEKFSRIKAKARAAVQWARSLWQRKGAQSPVPAPEVAAPRAPGRSPSFTKKGPGRRHRYGPGCIKLRKSVAPPVPHVVRGIPILCPTDHSLDPKWHLSRLAKAERERANARRG